MKNYGVLILTGIFLYVGSYLILRPQQYKDELDEFGEDVISRFPRWTVRIVGVFIITIGIGVCYLVLRASK